MRLKVGTKIGIIFLIFFIQVFSIWMFIYAIVVHQHAYYMNELQEEIEELKLVKSLQVALKEVVMPVNDFLIAGSEQNEIENFKLLREKVENLINRMDKLEFDRPQERELLNRIKEEYFQTTRIALQIFSIRDPVGNIEAGRLMEEMDRFADDASMDAQRFYQLAGHEVEEIEAGWQRTENRLNLSILGGILFNPVLILASLFFFRRTISSPIIALRDAALRVGKGNLEETVNVRSDDEIGDLAASFNKMTNNLQERTAQFSKATMELQKEIVERKKAEDALETLNEQLEAMVKKLTISNREIREFARIAAHDLKTPVRAIGTLAHWLLTDYSDKFDEQGKKQVELLVGRAKRMSDLIDAILEYSEIGRIEQKTREVDLNVLLTEVIREIAVPDNIEIAVENELPTVICEKRRMLRVFQNLLSNAVKYMNKPQGQIKIGCVEEDGFWKFCVADNGPGIEQKYFERIFRIFQTLSPRDEVESIGIGLSVVKKIVEMHGGDVWVESEVDQGSTFFFTLLKTSEQKETTSAAVQAEAGDCLMKEAHA